MAEAHLKAPGNGRVRAGASRGSHVLLHDPFVKNLLTLLGEVCATSFPTTGYLRKAQMCLEAVLLVPTNSASNSFGSESALAL